MSYKIRNLKIMNHFKKSLQERKIRLEEEIQEEYGKVNPDIMKIKDFRLEIKVIDKDLKKLT